MNKTDILITERRERTFLVLAGIFLSAMTLLNVVGITRFIQLGPLALAVGVLPYPLTFLCTDLISERTAGSETATRWRRQRRGKFPLRGHVLVDLDGRIRHRQRLEEQPGVRVRRIGIQLVRLF